MKLGLVLCNGRQNHKSTSVLLSLPKHTKRLSITITLKEVYYKPLVVRGYSLYSNLCSTMHYPLFLHRDRTM